jgi:tripartite-type tricarboxylate transporter receptor subunit TctC
VAGPRRVADLPDVPTLKEAGIEGVDVTQWYALFAPAGTPQAIVAALNSALNQVLNVDDVIRRIEDHGAEVGTGTPAQLRTLVETELGKWRGVVRSAQLTAG